MRFQNHLSIVISLFLVAGCAKRGDYAYEGTTASAPVYVGSTAGYGDRNATDGNRETIYNSGTATTAERTVLPGTTSIATATPSSSDQTVVTQIRQALSENPNLTEVLPNIQVSGTGGEIVLTGTVPSEQQKQAVETLVKSTPGVVSVKNQLEAALSPTSEKERSARIYSNGTSQAESPLPAAEQTSLTEGIDEASLSASDRTQDSTQALPPTSDRPNEEPRLYATNDAGPNARVVASSKAPTIYSNAQESGKLTPTSNSGDSRRYPSGQTNSPSSAEMFDVKIQGVSEADQSLGHKIIDELRGDDTIVAATPTIRITIDNGKAVLKGTVKSQEEKEKIASSVQGVTGVTEVENQLQIGAVPKAAEPAP